MSSSIETYKRLEKSSSPILNGTRFQETLNIYRKQTGNTSPPLGFFTNHPAWGILFYKFCDTLESDINTGPEDQWTMLDIDEETMTQHAGAFASSICAQSTKDADRKLLIKWADLDQMEVVYNDVRELWDSLAVNHDCDNTEWFGDSAKFDKIRGYTSEQHPERHFYEMALTLLSPIPSADPELEYIRELLLKYSFTEEETNTNPSLDILNKYNIDWIQAIYDGDIEIENSAAQASIDVNGDNAHRQGPILQSPVENSRKVIAQDPWLTALLADDVEEILRIANLPMLAEGILPVSALGFLFGESGSGKSFVILDAACSISTGEPWLGRDTPPEGGLVIYVAAEGANGLRIRKRGWEQERGCQAENMRILPEAVMMDDEKQVERLIGCIKMLCIRSDNNNPILIILDTFARSMLGEENSNTDAASFIRGCESLRNEFGSAVVSIHHSGHKDKGRMRGASALHAAADCVIKLESKGKNAVELTCTKSKDIEPFKPAMLKLEKITLEGISSKNGEPITTLAVRELSKSDQLNVNSVLSGNERLIFGLIRKMLLVTENVHKTELRKEYKAHELNRKKKGDTVNRQFLRGLKALEKEGLISEDDSEMIKLIAD